MVFFLSNVICGYRTKTFENLQLEFSESGLRLDIFSNPKANASEHSEQM